MRLLFVSSGKKTLSDLNPSIVGAFRELSHELDYFQLETYFMDLEPWEQLRKKMDRFQPTVAVIFGHDAHPVAEKLTANGFPVGLWVVNDPYSLGNYEAKVPHYDFMITQEASCVDFYERVKNKPTVHSPLAINPKNYYPIDVETKYDVCFIGNAWPGRRPFFDQLLPLIKEKKVILIGNKWNKLNCYNEVKSSISTDLVEPQEAARYYNQSKIVLNVHREPNDIGKNPYNLPAHTPNNRTFDIAACKAFQLTTYRDDLSLFYKEGEEMISYTDVFDLVQKINVYSKDDSLRERIAARAYERTMKEHTYVKRMKTVVQKLEELI